MKHLVKINRLIDQSVETSLSIDKNAKELSDILSYVRNDEVLLKDLALKGDLVNIFNLLHDTYLGSVARLTDYQNSHASLLLEFELSVQSDSKQINDCIQNKQFCFSRHGIFYCTLNCYLMSDTTFLINFKMQEYSKLQVQHISCLHEKSGLVSVMTNSMFLQNASFYTQIGRNFNVPDICLTLTKDNYKKCAPYFSMGPNYILQCRHGFVYTTGNLSYSDPLLNLYKLSYVPVLILDSHFPIQLNGKRIYKSNICEASQNIAITHETFFPIS